MRNRLRKIEKLEARNLLAANPLISEINYNQLFGDENQTQYVELRGTAGARFDDGSYLVIVDSEANDAVAGEIHGIVDLSGIQFGSNGFLVLLPMASPYTASPAANTLQSTSLGFGSLPGDIFIDSHELSDRLDFIFASNTFFLIQSDVIPLLGDDIDTDNDGIADPDGVFQNWQVHDSISTMWSLGNSHAYGSIAFVDSNPVNFPTVTAQPETSVVRVNGGGYVGRVDNSIGSQPEDWVSGTITKDNDFQDYVVRLAGGTFDQPSTMVMHGRQLDHLGRENFTAAARLQYFVDDNRDGQLDSTESFLAGVQVLADTNDNGVRDDIETVIEPDEFPQDLELNNLIPGVTLGVAGDQNVLIGFPIQAEQLFGLPLGTHVFANSGIPFFTDGFRFRADFYRPANSVSIAITGYSNFDATYGRLDAFNANGNMIGTRTSAGLVLGGRQTLRITSGSDNIAYVVAYPNLTPSNASPAIRLDTFSFRIPEAFDVTGDDGMATLNYLDAGDYTITETFSTSESYLSDPIGFQVNGDRNYSFQVPLTSNVPAVFEPGSFSVPENTVAGVELGVVKAKNPLNTIHQL